MIVLVLGGSRSGKSAFAEDLVGRLSEPITYVATGQVTDDDMAARIDAHQLRRPDSWFTVEAPGSSLAAALRSIDGSVLIDSLGTWLAGHHDFVADVDELCGVLYGRVGATVIVSDEVGMGVHPATPLGRMFRDKLGVVNQRVAAISERVVFAIAGRALELSSAETLLSDLVADVGEPGAVVTDAVVSDAVVTDAVVSDAVVTDAVVTDAVVSGAVVPGDAASDGR